MSKRTFLQITLALLLCFNLGGLAQQPATAPKAAKSKPITREEVEKLTTEVLTKTSEVRGLKLLHPVKSGVKSRTEIEQMILKNLAEETTPEELDAEFKTLVAFGLVPANFQYKDFMVKLYTEQVAGFYDPKTKELNLADWNSLEMQQPVMAHELTHALQDQHFDLRRFEKWPKGDGDREMAIHSLIEGDATALMIDYLMKPMGTSVTKIPLIALQKMNEQMNSPDMPAFNSAPNVIKESLIFPYSQGLIFAYEVMKAQGWEGVSNAYKDLPQSTEQILHPAKYLANEQPVKVALPDVATTLGHGWKRIKADVNGEFGYYLILAEHLDKVIARKASEGWGGDQYALYENAAKTQRTLVHLSRWDAAQDAAKFFEAYAARTAKRFPKATANKTPQQIVYAMPTGEILLELRGDAVLAIEGAAIGTAKKLAVKLWDSKTGN